MVEYVVYVRRPSHERDDTLYSRIHIVYVNIFDSDLLSVDFDSAPPNIKNSVAHRTFADK